MQFCNTSFHSFQIVPIFWVNSLWPTTQSNFEMHLMFVYDIPNLSQVSDIWTQVSEACPIKICILLFSNILLRIIPIYHEAQLSMEVTKVSVCKMRSQSILLTSNFTSFPLRLCISGSFQQTSFIVQLFCFLTCKTKLAIIKINQYEHLCTFSAFY